MSPPTVGGFLRSRGLYQPHRRVYVFLRGHTVTETTGTSTLEQVHTRMSALSQEDLCFYRCAVGKTT